MTLMDFTSPVSVVSSSTFSLREVEPSSAKAMTSLDGSHCPILGAYSELSPSERQSDFQIWDFACL